LKNDFLNVPYKILNGIGRLLFLKIVVKDCDNFNVQKNTFLIDIVEFHMSNFEFILDLSGKAKLNPSTS